MSKQPRKDGIPRGHPKLDRRDVLWIALAVAAAAAIRFVFYGGMSSPDELNTLRNGAQWWTGRFELRDALFIHDTRPLMFIPVGWSFAAFGVSAATALLWPLVASLAVVFLVYLIARRLFDRETAVYAVFCAAFFPLLVQEATRLLPGVVMNLLIALCALFFVVSEEVGRRRWLWLAASGMAYGAIQMAGELGIVLGLLFVAAVIVWRRHPLWTYWPSVAGFGAVTALFLLYQWVETGNPFFKLDLSKYVYAQLKAVAPRQPLYYTKLLLAPFAGGGGVFYLAGLGGLAALAGRRREALFFALWFALTWAFLDFGSLSVTEYRPLSKEVRYFSVVSVPAVILAGYAIAWARRVAARRTAALPHVTQGVNGARPRGRWVEGTVVTVACLLVAVVSLRTLYVEGRPLRAQQAKIRTVRDHVLRYEGKPVYVTHWFWNTEVGFFMRFDDDYFPSGYDPYHAVRLETADASSFNRYVQTLEPGAAIGPGLLVHDERLFEVSQGERESWSVGRGEIPEVLARIPQEWRLVERVALSDRYAVALYEIPEGATWPGSAEP
jgi:hypothetical protein